MVNHVFTYRLFIACTSKQSQIIELFQNNLKTIEPFLKHSAILLDQAILSPYTTLLLSSYHICSQIRNKLLHAREKHYFNQVTHCSCSMVTKLKPSTTTVLQVKQILLYLKQHLPQIDFLLLLLLVYYFLLQVNFTFK